MYVLNFPPCASCIKLNDAQCTAFRDPRHVLVSISRLRNTYQGTLTIVMNNSDIRLTTRNIVMFLLAIQLPPPAAADVILHFWCSSRLTSAMLATIKRYVREPIAAVVSDIGEVDPLHEVPTTHEWKSGPASVLISMYKQEWEQLLEILDVRHLPPMAELKRWEIVFGEGRRDMRDQDFFVQPSNRRMGTTMYDEVGVLMPFGYMCDAFNCANP